MVWGLSPRAPSSAPGRPHGKPSGRLASTRPAPEPPDPTPRVRTAPTEAPEPEALAPESSPPSACAPCERDRAELAERLRRLEAVTGPGVNERAPNPPAGARAPRFEPDALSASVVQAIEESGVTAEVAGVDCEGYPCFVWGTLDRHDELEVLLAAPGLESRHEEGLFEAVFTRDAIAPDGTRLQTHYYGVAFYPGDEDPTLEGTLRRSFLRRLEATADRQHQPE